MKRFLIAAAVAVATVITPALAADNGAALSAGQAGFYDQFDVGDSHQPRVIYLIYRQPRVIENVLTDRPPVYLRMLPDSAQHWRKRCADTAPASRGYSECKGTGTTLSPSRVTRG